MQIFENPRFQKRGEIMAYLADFVLVSLTAFTIFMLYASYKMERDPDWAYGGVIVLIFVFTILGGIAGWKLGYKIEQNITFLAHWHILQMFITIACTLISCFVTSIILIVALAHKAYDKNWHELAKKLTRVISAGGY